MIRSSARRRETPVGLKLTFAKIQARARGEESGFTLVELLIVTVVTPLVIGALAVMLLAVLRTQGSVSNRINGAVDAQLTSAGFVHDVQGADFLSTSTTLGCGSTGTSLLDLKSQGNQIVVSYNVVQQGSQYNLIRFGCTGGSTTTPSTQYRVASDIPSNQVALVTCSATITCTYSTGWIATAGIKQVYLSVSEPTTGATYSVTMTPREWNSHSAGLSINPFPITPLELFGTSSCLPGGGPAVLTMSNSSTITAGNGSAGIQVSSSCNGSVSLSGQATIAAAYLSVGDTTPSGSVTSTKQNVYPTPTYSAPPGDPLASLLTTPTWPSTSGNGSCSGSLNVVCTPGTYDHSPTIASNVNTVNFNPGNYIFNEQLSLSSNASYTFQSGTYEFKKGLNMSNSSNIRFDTGTYIFESSDTSLNFSNNSNIVSGPGGVFFYVASGAASFSNSVTVSLSGEVANYGVSIWDAAANGTTNPLTLGGHSTAADAYGGVYVPNGEIITGNNSSFSAAFMLANTLSLTGSTLISVG